MFKLSLAFSAATLAVGTAVADTDAYCTALTDKCPLLKPMDCKAAFLTVPLGDDQDVDQNTIGCRLKFLNNVAFNATTDCRYSGPTGGGRCGSVLESTCQIAVQVCGGITGTSYANEDDCKTGLGDIAFQWGSLQGAEAKDDDSLECRVYHAYTGQVADVHCSHFNRTSPTCKNRVAPNAAHYCDLLEYNCKTVDVEQFGGKDQCLGVAAGYAQTLAADPTGADANNKANSLGCREYHAQAASFDPAVHCEHAGPSGGGVCGTYAQAWGSISAAAPCMDPSVNAFLGAVNSTVLQNLIPKGPLGSYSTSLDTSGNTQACRIYHLGVAAVLPLAHCAHGTIAGYAGGGGCGISTVDNLCKFIGGSCGFGNAAWQFPSEAQCITDLTGLQFTGPQPDVSNNTFACRFYHAGVAASYAPGGIASGAVNATGKMQDHCGHVIKTAQPGGCGYVAPPTTKAPSAAPSVAPTAATAPTAKPAANSVSVISSLVSLIAVVASVFFL